MTKPSSLNELCADALSGSGAGESLTERLMSFLVKTDALLDGKDERQVGAQMHIEEAKSRILQAQAKAAFEFALANRIATAREVEVEEFFEGSGSGGVGFNLDDRTVGVNGRGAKVTRRVVRLWGWPTSESVEPAPSSPASPEQNEAS